MIFANGNGLTRFWNEIFLQRMRKIITSIRLPKFNEITKSQWKNPNSIKKTKTQFGTIQIAEEKSIKISK